MRKITKIALWSLGGVALSAISAGLGFYAGLGWGGKAIGTIAEGNEAYDALSQVRSSMAALGKNDLDLSQHQLAIHLRVALFTLGSLSKTRSYVRCSEPERESLTDAANYISAHPDPILFNADPFLVSGLKFCDSSQHNFLKQQ